MLVGMRVDELRRVAGDVPGARGSTCEYVRPGRLPPGVSIMLAAGEVARIDVDSAETRTNDGVSVGDSASRVEETYAGRSVTTPHKYVAGARYVTVSGTSPTDSSNRIVFEVENGRVSRYRAGRLPEVAWVERCG